MDALYEIPERSRFLESHFFGGLLHLHGKAVDLFFAVAVQKRDCLLDMFAVSFLCDPSLTGRVTLVYVIVEAGPLPARRLGQFPVAGTHLEQLSGQFYDVTDSPRRGIGPVVPRAVLSHTS